MTEDKQSSQDIPMTLCNQSKLNLSSIPPSSNEDNHLTQAQIKLWIPKNYHREPILSHLISDHGITVNITGAPCSNNLRDDRWFLLELRGKAKQIRSALAYLDKNKLQMLQG
jgi:ABC-type methionine transport system ATPase subunit